MACRLDTPLRVSGGVARDAGPVPEPGWHNGSRRGRVGWARHRHYWSIVISIESTTPATDTEAELAAASIELDPEAAELEAEAALIVEEPAPVVAATPATP